MQNDSETHGLSQFEMSSGDWVQLSCMLRLGTFDHFLLVLVEFFVGYLFVVVEVHGISIREEPFDGYELVLSFHFMRMFCFLEVKKVVFLK